MFVCSLFVFSLLLFYFSVVWFLFGFRCIMNGWDYLKWIDFHVEKVLVTFSFSNEDLNMLHVIVFANILRNNLMLNLHSFVQITKFCMDLISKNSSNSQILEFTKCENYFNRSKLLRRRLKKRCKSQICDIMKYNFIIFYNIT